MSNSVKNNHVNEDDSDLSQILNLKGLSENEVLRRLKEDGYNELPISKQKKTYHILLQILREPMVFLLIMCGTIYLFLGDPQEAIMLFCFVFIIIGITIYQEQKAERTLDALRDLSSPRALVLRDGKRKRIPGREVVRNDVVFLNEGDRVPADGILILKSSLALDESLLTGESIPVDKLSLSSKVYAATTVVRGHGVMKVNAIGTDTEVGRIGKVIQNVHQEPTQLELQTDYLVRVFAIIALVLCILVFMVFSLTQGNWINGFLAGLTLAMAILPNEIPAVLTIFLALGAWRISQQKVLTRKMSAIENLGAATVLCVDKTGTLTLNQMSIQKLFTQEDELNLSNQTNKILPEKFHELLEYGILASQPDPYDPMEKAFLEAGDLYLQNTEHLHADWTLQREYPLSTELLSITHAWKSKIKGEFRVGAKGAPEAIVDLCHMGHSQARRISEEVERMSQEGLRVLAVAKSLVRSNELPGKQHDFDFQFLGLVGLADPIRKEVPLAIQKCKTAGVKVIMITGDHPSTAKSIARQIGLQNPDQLITGTEMKNMSDAELQSVVKKIHVYSRVTSHQKWKLVEVLKKNGEIVAMTGDGVNDAPALQSAQIGIAMGGRGTDVARESASLVLLNDDFASIVEAIRMGRRIYVNLRSAFTYLLAIHIPIAGLSVLPVLLKLPLILMPAHIAFLHLIIEPVCSIAFEASPVNQDILNLPPRNSKEPLLSRKVFFPSLIQGGTIFIILSFIYIFSIYRGNGERDGRALVFTSLIISNLVLIFTSRNSLHPVNNVFAIEKNRTFLGIILGTVMILGWVLYIPALRDLFRFSTLHFVDLVICIFVGIVSVVWLEGVNKFRRNINS